MSILNSYPNHSTKHRGEILYESLSSDGARAQHQGRRVEAVKIGHEALALINAWLTEANRKPTALHEVSFCGREGIDIIIDYDQPMRVVALAVV